MDKIRGKTADGFTLVELIITVAVIAILAAIAIPMYFKFVKKARETNAISYIHQIIQSEEIYRIDLSGAGVYTDDFDQLELVMLISDGSGINARVNNDYRFELFIGAGPHWEVIAKPVSLDTSMRWFYSDETNGIRYEIGSTPSASSPMI